MALVNVVTIAAYLLAQADRLGPKVGGHLALCATFVRWTGWTLAVAAHCYDDSTMNIVVAITIITIIRNSKTMIVTALQTEHFHTHNVLIIHNTSSTIYSAGNLITLEMQDLQKYGN